MDYKTITSQGKDSITVNALVGTFFPIIALFPSYWTANFLGSYLQSYEFSLSVRDSQGISYYGKRFPGNFLLFKLGRNLEKTTLVILH